MTGRMIGHFEILDKLDEGGMGVVWKARDTKLNRIVAIKVLPPGKIADDERKRRFTQEARSASALNHPNIVTIYEIASAEGVDYIAMEYVAGQTLGQLIPRKGMKLADCLKYAIQIADALARAHDAGIVHRDLKPGNILVTREGTVKVVDFGLAKLTETGNISDEDQTRTIQRETQEGTIVGTVAYMSPEQAEGKKVDARSDIFAFGAVLYEMVTGQRAFQGASAAATLSEILHRDPKPLNQAAPNAPSGLATLIARCLRKDRDRRYQYAGDLRVALIDLKEEIDSSTSPVAAAPQRGPAPAPAKKWMAFAVGAFLLAVLGILAITKTRSQTAPTGPPVIVLMDTTAPGGVYDPNTRSNGGTNADDLSDDLRDLPVTLDKESVGAAWNREDEVLRQNPDLILIHRSAFFHAMILDFGIGYPVLDGTAPAPPAAGQQPSQLYLYTRMQAAAQNRLEAFLGYAGLSNPRTRFLIYSRGGTGPWSTAEYRQTWAQNIAHRFPRLKGRIFTIDVPGGDEKATFRDPATIALVRKNVATIFGLPLPAGK